MNIKPTIIFDDPGFLATTVLLGDDGLPPEDVSLVLLSVGAQFTPGSHLIALAILPCWLGQQYLS